DVRENRSQRAGNRHGKLLPTSWRSTQASAEDIAGNNVLLHLARPLADAPDADLAIPAFEGQILGHPQASVDLHRAVDHAATGFGRDQFRYGRFGAERFAALGLGRRIQYEPAGGATIDLVVDQHPLNAL